MAQTISSFSELVNEWYWVVSHDGTNAHLGTGKHHGWVHWGYTDIKWCHNPGWLHFPGENVGSLSFKTKVTWMRLKPWFCCWPCLSKGLNLILHISLPKLISDYTLIITHHFAGCVVRHLVLCWICFCVCDLVPPGIRVTGVLPLSPAPGMTGGHASVVGCHPGKSYQSFLHQVKQPMPVILIFLRPCHLRFCTHLVSE